MDDINQVFQVGRLTRDSEIKYTAAGTAVARFSIAINRSVKKGDSWVDEANFFDCTLWGKLAERMGKYLLKGKQVAITGELRQERWEKEGQKFSKIGIVVTTVQLIGGQRSDTGAPAEGPKHDFDEGHSFDDDEIPF